MSILYKWRQLSKAEQARRHDLQNLFEESLYDESIARYWADYDWSPDLGIPEQRLLEKADKELTQHFQAWIDYALNNDRTPEWAILLLGIGATKMANVALRVLINRTFSSSTWKEDENFLPVATAQGVANDITKVCLDIVAFNDARDNDPEAFRFMDHYTKQWTVARCNSFSKKFSKIKQNKMSFKKRVNFGHHILRILEETDVVVFFNDKIKKGNGYVERLYVTLNPNLLNQIYKMHQELSLCNKLIYRPMFVPPVPHTLESPGGNLNQWTRKPVVSGFRFAAATQSEERNWIHDDTTPSKPGQNTIDQLNGLMNTEWEINSRVLEVMTNLFENNTKVANLPAHDEAGMSFTDPFPEDGTGKEKAEWMDRKYHAWCEWHKEAMARSRMFVRLSLAKEMQRYGFFYHVWTCDFRGRVYTITEMLSPQSGDFDRSLLLFSKPKPQTKSGLFWLKVHVANLFDVDKCSFEQRVAWVDENMDMFRQINDDPYDNLSLWVSDKTKKNPSFQRLAAVFELCREDGMTQLPVQLDGSCNGSQHWAAIMRDPVLAELVNIVETDSPGDLYQEVADTCSVRLAEVEPEVPVLQGFLDHWEGTVPRAVTKRPTMCDSYGLTFYGIRKYLRIEGHLSEDWVPKENLAGALTEFARVVDYSLKDVLVEANKGKDYLKQISFIAGELGRNLKWTTPSGFEVHHRYMHTQPRVSVAKLFRNRRLVFRELSNEVDVRSAETAVPPNFIHSLDAAHMCLVVCDMLSLGITDFSMIHDSFGCHACDVSLMRSCILKRFLFVHRDYALKTFKDEVETHLGIELPEPPPVGDLDIERVTSASYLVG